MKKQRIDVLSTIKEVCFSSVEMIPKSMLCKLGGVLLVFVSGNSKGQIRRKVNFIKRAVREARKIK